MDSNKNGDPTVRKNLIVLVVGDISNWREAGDAIPVDSQLAFAEYKNVSKELLATVNPDLVYSPLMCSTFDCLDLAQTLDQIGFKGGYRVTTQKLPRPKMIMDEVHRLCPGVDFEFIITDQKLARLN